MKAQNYLDRKRKPQYSPIGWYATEKFDGQRAQWRPGIGLISRYGNRVNAPGWFLEHFRDITVPLDGELFVGYGNWGLTGIFRSKADPNNQDLWKKVQYLVFDLPDPNAGIYHHRMMILDRILGSPVRPSPIKVIPRTRINSLAELETLYQSILARGGEGVILNNPEAFYRDGRSDSILKHKPILDDECVIVGYKPGNDRNAGRLGSFIVHPIEDGIPNPKREFSVSGMNDVIRNNYRRTHPIGTVITYTCREYTSSGKPRHPSYIGKCHKMILRDPAEPICAKLPAPAPAPPPAPPVQEEAPTKPTPKLKLKLRPQPALPST